jgi:hydrogenase maturation protein HypF
MERRAIAVQGVVQGVGFRPFVYGLASRLDLRGFVKNRTGGVLIEVEGECRSLDSFLAELSEQPPPLAQIDTVSWEARPPCGDRQFRIEYSDADAPGSVFVSPDVATCDDCLAELFDPADFRYRYPFLNCTNCGPRLTIIRSVPYDRERTTMAAFRMCPVCRAEYDDPGNRRFHAQPTVCPACGPQLQLCDHHGKRINHDDPLLLFASHLRQGKIGALKGLGGYHLACDARNEATVAELRRRKHRDEKPFAVMVADAERAQKLCEVNAAERELLVSSRRPIVLLRKRPSGGFATETIAPGNPYLGVMLPYTPLHHLLVRALDMPLVMTSGNRSDEPIAFEDHDALERLAGIADLFLIHDRPIHVRCDDSVTRVVDGMELPLRRSRGYAPQRVALPLACPRPILAVGGQLKGTFAFGRDRHGFVSHHLGDLDRLEAYRAFERDIDLYQELFALNPEIIAHDLHPDYASTRYARERAKNERLIPVQHHHAHMASCMAENGLNEPVIGVSFDGTGYGTDGAVWGGEFLVGDYRRFVRAAHLRYVGMPGSDQAIREPWRMAVAHLMDAGADCASFESRLPSGAVRTARKMLERRFNTPLTSSVGRLFDAVAALAGVRDCVSYEGQAAMELEWLATQTVADGVYPFALLEDGKSAGLLSRARSESSSGVSGRLLAPPGARLLRSKTRSVRGSDEKLAPDSVETLTIDTRPLIGAVVQDVERGVRANTIARRFHSTMVQLIASVCERIRQRVALDAVVLSGGVFMNALLTSEVMARLTQDDFHVYRHRLVPPNDGGLSLGQLAVAAAQI